MVVKIEFVRHGVLGILALVAVPDLTLEATALRADQPSRRLRGKRRGATRLGKKLNLDKVAKET